MSGILGAPNPFDATHGFTILSRGDAELRDGTTVGAVAAGGDLTVGPYEVTATPPAVLDGTPVAVLADGAISVEGPDDRLTIGAAAEVLAGDVDALDPATVDGAVAVASPDTFDRAFQGVFADLQARSSLLASLPVTVTATDSGGAALDDLSGADVHLAADLDDGSAGVWTVTADDLARVQSITIDPAPTPDHPLVINVDGGGSRVTLDPDVTVSGAAEASLVWNVVDARSIEVSGPLPGSLLAPSAPVRIEADVSGSVIAASVRQVGGQVGGRPFAAELPRAGEAGDPEAAATDDPAAIEAVPPATGNNAVITVKVGGDRVSTSAVGSLAGVTLQLYDGDQRADDACGRHVHDLHLRRRRRLLVHRSQHPGRAARTATAGSGSCGRVPLPVGSA